MYQKYAEAQGWRFEVMEASMNGVGGFKEVVAMVSGQSVYSKLKYESGAHRVQRVPVTESQGRVHTSTATVLVMPEVEEVEYDIDPKDLRVDIYQHQVLVDRTSIRLRLPFVSFTCQPISRLRCRKNVPSRRTVRKP